MGPQGQRGARIPPSSSAGSIPEAAGTKLHPGAMALSMDSVRMPPDSAAAPVDSSGMHNHVGAMHTSAGDVRVPSSRHKAAPLAYPVNGRVPSSPNDPTPYATTAVAMRRTVSASSANQQSRRSMSATTATHMQNGRTREFRPGSTAQYDLLTPRNRPLPPTPIDHMQVSPKRQQHPQFQLPPQVGLRSQTQYPRQQSQGRVPASQRQAPRTQFQYPGPGAYPPYAARPQMAQLPQRQPVSGYPTSRAPPPVSYPQAGASRGAHTRVSPSYEKKQASPTQAHTQVSPSHVTAIVSPTQAHTRVSPSHEKTQVSPAPPQVPVIQPVAAGVPVLTAAPKQQHPSSKKIRIHVSSKKYDAATPISENHKPPTETFDMLLPKEVQSVKNSPGSRDSTSSSVSAEIQEYTDQMSRALEQFDSLLAPPPQRHIVQTSL